MIKFGFSTIAKTMPLRFRSTFTGLQPRPFDDDRFAMFLARQPLNQSEVEHINAVMDSVFANISSSSKQITNEAKQWTDPRLRQAILELKSILSKQSLELTIKRREPKPDEQPELSGFMRIQGINYPCEKYIHELQLLRNGQVLTCSPRELPKIRDANAKEVIDEVRSKLGKKIDTDTIKQEILNKGSKTEKTGEFGGFIKFIGDRYFAGGNSTQSKGSWWSRKKPTEITIEVDQYDMDVQYCFTRNQKLIEEATATIQTKWLFAVNSKMAQSILRNRRRILFDVDNWMRGSFIHIRRFDLIQEERI